MYRARKEVRVQVFSGGGHTSPSFTWGLVFLCQGVAQSDLEGRDVICIMPRGECKFWSRSPIKSKPPFIPITFETPASPKILDSFQPNFRPVRFHSYHCSLSCEKKSPDCFTDRETKAQTSEEVQPGSQAEVRLKCSAVTSGQFGLEPVWFPGRVLKL